MDSVNVPAEIVSNKKGLLQNHKKEEATALFHEGFKDTEELEEQKKGEEKII